MVGFIAFVIRGKIAYPVFQVGLTVIVMPWNWKLPSLVVHKYLDLPGHPWRPMSIPEVPPLPKVHRPVVLVRQRVNCDQKENFSDPRLVYKVVNNAVIYPDSRHEWRTHTIFTRDFIFFPREYNVWATMISSPALLLKRNRVQVIQYAVYFCYRLHVGFFHAMVESMPILFCMDKKIVSSSALLLGSIGLWKVIRDALSVLEISPSSICYVRDKAVFVQNLYIMNPFRRNLLPTSIQVLRHFIFQKFRRDRPPWRRTLIKRKRDVFRYVFNLDQVAEALDSTFEGRKFEVKICEGNLSSQIEYFRDCFCVIGVRGSGLTNVVWMSPNTIMVEIQARYCDCAFANCAMLCGLWIVETTHPGVNMVSAFNLKVDVVMEAVRTAFSIAKQ
jgi:hypothetical protein